MNTQPKILFWDVETAPFKIWSFRLGKTVLTHESLVKGEAPKLICISYKWLGDSETKTLVWDKRQDCEEMLNEFTTVVESADVCIAHNGDKFDVKVFNTARLIYGLRPVSWPTSDDTLKQLRKHFHLPSNRLDYVSKLLFGEGKNAMSFGDWVRVVEDNDRAALAKMAYYCAKDVELLEKTWVRIQPYITPKVNLSLIINNDKAGCPQCGSIKSTSRGRRYTRSGVYQRRICRSCRATFSSPLPKAEKSH